MEKMILNERVMFVRDRAVFSNPTDDFRWISRDNFVHSESLIYYREMRVIEALR